MRNWLPLVALLVTSCTSEAPLPGSTPLFRSDDAAIPFQHDSGARGARFIGEIVGSGVAFIDGDGDGDMDLYLVNGAPGEAEGDSPPPHNAYYVNDGGQFTDMTKESGLGDEGAGMGVAVADVDGDGDSDIYLANDGENRLYINDGSGVFVEEARERGVDDPAFSSAPCFFDADLDGDLDLYVAEYLLFDPETFVPCKDGGTEVYCAPAMYPGLPGKLFLNDGRGHFIDVSAITGIADHPGKGLGVVSIDIEGDGDFDLYVANDGEPNFLFVNRLKEEGVLRFDEEALLAGCAFGEGAKAEAGMGVEAADLDGDGDEDLIVTNLEAQTNSLYNNDGDALFTESSFARGLGSASLAWVGFGVRALDVEHDGDLDIFIANGHIIDNVEEVRQGEGSFPQPDQFFLNTDGHFEESREALIDVSTAPSRVSRAVASADLDNDGDLDLIITCWGAGPRLLRSLAAGRAPVVGLLLEGNPPYVNRDAIGAIVTVEVEGKMWRREHRVQSSYLASHDPRLLFALPAGSKGAKGTIRWPDGSEESAQLDAGAYHHWVAGSGVIETVKFEKPRG